MPVFKFLSSLRLPAFRVGCVNSGGLWIAQVLDAASLDGGGHSATFDHGLRSY